MIGVYGEVAAGWFDVRGIGFEIQHVQRVFAARRVGEIVIERTLEQHRQLFEVWLTFDDVVVGASFQSGHGGFLITEAGNDHHGEW